MLRLLVLATLGATLTFAIDGDYRIEHDTMGEVRVPKDALWAAQTQRSLTNFRIGITSPTEYYQSDEPSEPSSSSTSSLYQLPREAKRAFFVQKLAAAKANTKLKELSPQIGGAIEAAAVKVLTEETNNGKNGGSGVISEAFPLSVFQTGSGTQSNMNANEVIASLASTDGAKVHPNDHVNRGQSTNDGFPTVMHITLALSTLQKLLPALDLLYRALVKKSEQSNYADVIKSGRTHLQDATPMTIGQEFSAWAYQVRESMRGIVESLVRDVSWLAQGGTAVGTGLNAHARFAEEFVNELNEIVQLEALVGIVPPLEKYNLNSNDEGPIKPFRFRPLPNKFSGIASHDALTRFAGQQSALASAFMKLANDVKLLTSTVVGELKLDTVLAGEPGSSIMPGKVNPTQAEMLSMVAAQVIGNSQVVTVANSHGQLQLNALKPVMLFNLIESNRLLAEAARGFALNCVGDGAKGTGLQLGGKIEEHLGRNLMLVTALNPVIGYENAAKVAKKAGAEGISLRVAAVDKLGLLSGEEFDRVVRAEKMLGPLGKRKDEL